MAQLTAFFAFLMFSTFYGVGLVIVAAAAIPLLRKPPRARAALFLPAIWIFPLAVAGAFIGPSEIMQTAYWVGFVSLGGLLVFLLSTIAMIVLLKGARIAASVFALANLPFALMSVLVGIMASSGAWL